MASFSLSGMKTGAGKLASGAWEGTKVAAKEALKSSFNANRDKENSGLAKRIGGAIGEAAREASFGQMGTLGKAMTNGSSKSKSGKSPTGGGGVPSAPVKSSPIKADNVIGAINQSTQQIVGGLNTLSATHRMGFNAMTNQIQAQAQSLDILSGYGEDTVLVLRDILQELNRQGYQDKAKYSPSGVIPGSFSANDNSPNKNNDNNGILSGILSGLLVEGGVKGAEKLLGKTGAKAAEKTLGKTAEKALGKSLLKKIPGISILAGLGFAAQRLSEGDYLGAGLEVASGALGTIPFIGTAGSIALDVGIASRDLGAFDQLSASPAEAAETSDGSELTQGEIDQIFKMAPIGTDDAALMALAQRMFPGRKYNTLKARIKQLQQFMQPGPQSSLQGNTQLASNEILPGMLGSSGQYLANRQQGFDQSGQIPALSGTFGTSEGSLRQEEATLEKSSQTTPNVINIVTRELFYKADSITFDTDVLKFNYNQQEGQGPGGAGGPGSGGGGGGGQSPGGGGGGGQGGGGQGAGGADASAVPGISEETKAAASALQSKGTMSVAKGAADPFSSYSEEQLRSQGVVSHTNTDGTKVYSYAPGGIGGHADRIGGSGASQTVTPGGGNGKFVKGGSFDQNSPILMNRIMKDFGLTKEQAAGVVGNLGHESIGLTAGIEEKDKRVKNKGLGWAQWTGPRRKAFEAYLKETGQDSTDPEANYGFLKKELETTHKAAIAAVKKTDNVQDAVTQFEHKFEVSADYNQKTGAILKPEHVQSRMNYGKRAYEGYDPKAGETTTPSSNAPTAVAPDLASGLAGMTPAGTPAASTQTGASPISDEMQKNRPYQIKGMLNLEGKQYHFGSGGRNRGSMTYGEHDLRMPGEAGVNAQGLKTSSKYQKFVGNSFYFKDFWDPKVQDMRDGVLIHSASDVDKLYSSGCIAIAKDEWPAFKAHLVDYMKRNPGKPLSMMVNPDGSAAIGPKGSFKGADVTPASTLANDVKKDAEKEKKKPALKETTTKPTKSKGPAKTSAAIAAMNAKSSGNKDYTTQELDRMFADGNVPSPMAGQGTSALPKSPMAGQGALSDATPQRVADGKGDMGYVPGAEQTVAGGKTDKEVPPPTSPMAGQGTSALPKSPMSGQGTAAPLPVSPMAGQGTANPANVAQAEKVTPPPSATPQPSSTSGGGYGSDYAGSSGGSGAGATQCGCEGAGGMGSMGGNPLQAMLGGGGSPFGMIGSMLGGLVGNMSKAMSLASAAPGQGPVNNTMMSHQTKSADTTGSGYPDPRNPMPGMDEMLAGLIKHAFG